VGIIWFVMSPASSGNGIEQPGELNKSAPNPLMNAGPVLGPIAAQRLLDQERNTRGLSSNAV
jgi:hypothetical protein